MRFDGRRSPPPALVPGSRPGWVSETSPRRSRGSGVRRSRPGLPRRSGGSATNIQHLIFSSLALLHDRRRTTDSIAFYIGSNWDSILFFLLKPYTSRWAASRETTAARLAVTGL